MHPPEINLIDQDQRIIHYSELSEVFDREELQYAFQNLGSREEKIYNPHDQLVSHGDMTNNKCIIYISRGILVEKDGDLDDLYSPFIKHKRGSITCLQNLLPDAENNSQISDVFCHQSGIAIVEYLNLEYLRGILAKDQEKLLKLWKIMSYRLIMIHHEKLPQFKFITKEKVRMFVKMCDIKMYQPGDTIDLSCGGVCFRGGFTELGHEINEAELNAQKIDLEQRKLEMKYKQSLQVSQAHNNTSYLASKKQIAKK